MSKEMLLDAAVQARNSAPVVTAAVLDTTGTITLDSLTKLLLFIYALGQVSYLAWKWYGEYKDRRNASITVKD